jgi:hypothetical protein
VPDQTEKEARMFERSKFARFPFDPALFRGPAQRAAEPGSPFLGYFFWRDKRSNPLPGGSRQSIHEEPHVLQHRREHRKETGFPPMRE